jgi:chromosome segregation ATPase
LLEDAFVEALGRGRAVYGYAKQVKKARQELKEMHVELEAMDTDLNAMEAELVSEGATPRRRVHLLRKIRQLETDRDLFLNDIEDLEAQVADMQANLKRMRADAP